MIPAASRSSVRLPLATAIRYSTHIVNWLSPHCERLEVAGSIRRRRPDCGDIDLVAIPKVTEAHDLLGAVASRTNHLWQFLRDYVLSDNTLNDPGQLPHIQSGGDREGESIIIQLPKCQLDVWFATQSTWSTRLLCRTGSKEHNIWFANRATDRGLHWTPNQGLRLNTPTNHDPIPAATEAYLYGVLGLGYIPPEHRDLPWLTKHIDSGL